MIGISTTSAFFAIAAAVVATSTHADRFDLHGCLVMELVPRFVQNAEPKEDAPDAAPEAQPGDGSDGANSEPPDDNDGDDGADSGSDQASPPDTAQPPGCIFRNGPLDLIV